MAGRRLDLDALARLTQKPPLWARNEEPFWDDPHISKGMLEAHLDPGWDAASYRHETIERSVEWLVSHLGLQPGQRVLDLGCGPGLYCERLARRGLRATGMDYSRRSIAYAQAQAREQGLSIKYIYQNYLSLDFSKEFDAALLISYDLGVFSDSDRDALFCRVHRALKPGGAFVFDLMTPRRKRHQDGQTSWNLCPAGGFWRPGSYLELTRYFQYPEAEAQLRLVTIVEPDGKASIYRLWDRFYTVGTIAPALEATGFRVDEAWSDLTGKPYEDASETLGIVARRL